MLEEVLVVDAAVEWTNPGRILHESYLGHSFNTMKLNQGPTRVGMANQGPTSEEMAVREIQSIGWKIGRAHV